MKRREFIGVLAGAATTWPLAARSQQDKIPHIGILTLTSSTEAPTMRALRNAFHDLGYIGSPGQTR